MSLISFTAIQDGVTGVNASATNTPLSTIYNDYNGNITDANMSASAGIATSKLALGASPTSWTPTWTNVTIGNAVVVGKYSQLGPWVFATLSVIWGSTTSASGNIVFSLPVAAASYPGTPNTTYIGDGTMFDVSGSTVYDSNVTWLTTGTAGVVNKPANGTWTTIIVATNASPVTWANTDEWSFKLAYRTT